MEGFINATQLYQDRSVKRMAELGLVPRGSHVPVLQPSNTQTSAQPAVIERDGKRQTTNGWFTSLQMAVAARDHFRRAALSHDHMHADKGLALLFTSSFEVWPPVALGDMKLILPATIDSMVETLSDEYRKASQPDSDPTWKPETIVPRSPFRTERQEAAVKIFWEQLPDPVRARIKPLFGSPIATFEFLELIASDPDKWHGTLLKAGAAPLDAITFLEVVQSAKATGLFRV
ncbi:hypothetical protein B0H12DRAFT_407737 [Mycena haematopus]|nr:hypothetical protein B0H12DRAFT_407737 [Mycena haematopus]